MNNSKDGPQPQAPSDADGAVLFVAANDGHLTAMAAALVPVLCGPNVRAQSAAGQPGQLDPAAVSAMAELGIDISAHRPTALDELDLHRFGRVVALDRDGAEAARGRLLAEGTTPAPACELLEWTFALERCVRDLSPGPARSRRLRDTLRRLVGGLARPAAPPRQASPTDRDAGALAGRRPPSPGEPPRSEALASDPGSQPELSFQGLVGTSPSMLALRKKIRKFAPVPYPVYIHGESGTGKELVARALHDAGDRAGLPFVAINCSALQAGLAEAELFGHARGAYTGASEARPGFFASAGAGTLFLDEVGDLNAEVQAKLLRVLEDGTYTPVGSTTVGHARARIISASNRDLRTLVDVGQFREDLFYRLTALPISVPPLRARLDDIPDIVDHVLKRVHSETGRHAEIVDPRVLERLLRCAWPGNVRQLIKAVQHAVVHASESRVTLRDLPPLPEERPADPSLQAHVDLAASRTQRGPRRKFGREAAQDALQRAGGNKTRAAAMLGISRPAFYRALSGHDPQP